MKTPIKNTGTKKVVAPHQKPTRAVSESAKIAEYLARIRGVRLLPERAIKAKR